MYGDRFIPSIQIAKFLGNPVKPIAKDKKVEPAIIKAIIQEVLVAPNNDKLNVSLLSVPWKKDSIKAPITPKDAASVAVAMPV